MSKVYFSIAGLFNDVKVNNGQQVRLDLQSIKVDGVEQLTSDFFSEVNPTFIDPHAANFYSFGQCIQSGTYPSPTSISSCAIGVNNSFNPFRETWQVNYSDNVDGRFRGEILNTISGNPYGVEQFLFGFDNIDTPVNDIVGGGSTGATTQGCFYLDIDFTLDFEMIIDVQIRNSVGITTKAETHTYNFIEANCTFEYEVADSGYAPVQDSYFGAIPLESSNWAFVDAGNGFGYASPGRSGYILKIEWATGNLTQIGVGSFVAGLAPQYLKGIKSPTTNKIYFMPEEGGANDVLVLDPTNDTFTTFGAGSFGFLRPRNLTVTPSGIIYTTSNGVGKFFKIDTNLETVTELTEAGAFGGGVAEYSSNGFVYFISSVAGSGEFYKLDTTNDNITTVVEPAITDGAFGSVITADGNIYATGNSPSSLIKLETLNSDAASMISFTSATSLQSISLMPDGNAYTLNTSGIVFKIDTSTDGVQSVYAVTTTQPYLDITAFENSIYSIPVSPTGAEILKIDFEFLGSNDAKDSAWLSGGNSGWIIPACSNIVNTNFDPIVTQALGLPVPDISSSVPGVFDSDFIKSCCYFSPVLAHLVDTDSFKNDVNGFLFNAPAINSNGNPIGSIDMVLLKNGGVLNGGTDIPLIDNTYGTYYNFGSLPGHAAKKGYQLEWQKVLQVEGEATYQFQATISVFGTIGVSVSVPFKLREYTNENAKGTVRIQSVMDGFLRNQGIDYKGLEWLDGVRFRGFFGNNQPEYEEERIIFTNRLSRQLRSEMINNYVLQSMRIPSCITEPILKYHNLANYLLITDYNPVNHRNDYVQSRVVFDGIESIDYNSRTNNAVLNLRYKDYRQGFTKSNC